MELARVEVHWTPAQRSLGSLRAEVEMVDLAVLELRVEEDLQGQGKDQGDGDHVEECGVTELEMDELDLGIVYASVLVEDLAGEVVVEDLALALADHMGSVAAVEG